MISNGAITVDSTAMTLSITAGTSNTLVPISSDGSGRELVFSGDTNAVTRKRLKVRTVEPKVNTSMPSGYNMRKGELTLLVPQVLANGKMEYNRYRILRDESVELTTNQALANKRLVAQLVLDSDFDDFWALNSNQ